MAPAEAHAGSVEMNEISKALFAGMVAVMMMATGVVVCETAPESDASASDGLATYNFFFPDYGNNRWVTYSADGYNAAIALKNALGTGVSMDENYIVTSSYTTINSAYGQINYVSGHVGSTYTVFMYSPVSSSWVLGPTTALGFYQAYSDYDSNLRTANIIIHPGSISTTSDIQMSLPDANELASIFSVTSTNAFKVTFHISIANGVSKPSSISQTDWDSLVANVGDYVGYGSNCYLALKNAISNVYGNDAMLNTTTGAINASSYGYVSSILGVSEVNSSTTSLSIWDYWSIYMGSSVASDYSNYSLFTGGFLTPLSGLGTDYECNELCYQYTHSEYPL